ncbi:hypothetical protein J6590_077380 [Homalodisca vitripennis]|nr:hypothetical protein J6590_077380 [Homalodisca vitripennis]
MEENCPLKTPSRQLCKGKLDISVKRKYGVCLTDWRVLRLLTAEVNWTSALNARTVSGLASFNFIHDRGKLGIIVTCRYSVCLTDWRVLRLIMAKVIHDRCKLGIIVICRYSVCLTELVSFKVILDRCKLGVSVICRYRDCLTGLASFKVRAQNVSATASNHWNPFQSLVETTIRSDLADAGSAVKLGLSNGAQPPTHAFYIRPDESAHALAITTCHTRGHDWTAAVRHLLPSPQHHLSPLPTAPPPPAPFRPAALITIPYS